VTMKFDGMKFKNIFTDATTIFAVDGAQKM
jgi:hypothetical protein